MVQWKETSMHVDKIKRTICIVRLSIHLQTSNSAEFTDEAVLKSTTLVVKKETAVCALLQHIQRRQNSEAFGFEI